MSRMQYYNKPPKPYPYAEAILKRSDEEISELVLTLKLKDKLPIMYDKNYQIIDEPTVTHFIEFLKQSVIVKQERRRNRRENAKARVANEPLREEIRLLKSQIEELELKVREAKRKIVKRSCYKTPLLIDA